MIAAALYRIALLPSADEREFVAHMAMVFRKDETLQLTRITRGFSHQLLKADAIGRQYAWLVTVDLVTDAGYDFIGNTAHVRSATERFGLLTDVEVFESVAEVTGTA